ncbi:uroporphyrinogen-III synthase [Granulicella arctica]|uniref:Uroporphyrinogen-III synthase n=1 Tax=Granulicella arctica TaxID=940613 RepID=A0A7Y9PEA2_9BACT|nr:uroporphyrinogen-III synthase [Granulicella arctica]NYF78338.1 uroporphyrinogen-III synthase [Granulicella arctica]
MAHASFNGLRVLSLESRRAKEVSKLIRTYGGDPFVVPSMREIPLESNTQALEFAGHLMAGKFDLVIFFTGVGVRALLDIVATRHSREDFLTSLRAVKIAARGPKPVAALRDVNVPITVTAAEPSTWHELMSAIDAEFGDSLSEFHVAVQEYGASNPEFLAELTMKCAAVTKVPVYQWALPEDIRPLRECVLGIASGNVDVILFMTAVQVIHLFQVAEQMGCEDDLRAGLASIVVVSIGPTTTEELAHYKVIPDFEPSRPKMGFIVNEAAQYAYKVLERKRAAKTITTDTLEGNVPSITKASTTVKIAATTDAKQVRRVQLSTPAMAGFRDGLTSIDFLHEISSRIAAADPLHVVLGSIVDFVTTVVPCDSCFIYVLEHDKLVLRASKNPHADLVDQLGVPLGQGITGWVAEHREPVAIASNASNDPRFVIFKNLPEDHFEAILCTPIVCASKVVGVINLQHRLSYQHTPNELRLVSMLGFLVGAEIERARLETENTQLAGRLETRKAVDRAKGILQRDLEITEDEAYRTMQRESRQRRKSMREIAEAILLGNDMKKR